MLLTMHSTMSGFINTMNESTENVTAMGQAFDDSRNDDSFYLPPEVFENEDFKRAMNSFLSPDGKAARFIISHRGDPASPEGIARIDQIKTGGRGGAERDASGKRQDLYGGRRVNREGLEGRLQVRSVDCRSRSALPDFHHHARHHRAVSLPPWSSSARLHFRWAHRLGCPCCSGSTFWASNCTGWCSQCR